MSHLPRKGVCAVFQTEQLKNKNFIVYNKNYRFKEDWLLQAVLLQDSNKRADEMRALDWIAFLDEHFSERVKIFREYYTCDIEKCFEGPAGFKLEFFTKDSAVKYCDMLNQRLKERIGLNQESSVGLTNM
jgi:hypothetical protein